MIPADVGRGFGLAVLYDDAEMLAVDKPAGLVVHPTYKNPAGTLLDAVRSATLPRPSIVGRLDKFTSGIVLIAKSAQAHAALQRALAAPDAIKEYFAIVHGRVDVEGGRIDLRIRVDERDRRRVIASADAGAPSVTLFERIRVAGDVTLLKCRLLTGRRHQIRAHLAAAGWPIVGDHLYGFFRGSDPGRSPVGPGSDPGLGRHALHASRLGFSHPISGSRVDIQADFPAYFDLLLTSMS